MHKSKYWKRGTREKFKETILLDTANQLSKHKNNTEKNKSKYMNKRNH